MKKADYYIFRANIACVMRKKRAAMILLRRILYKNRTSTPYLSGDAFALIAEYAPYGANGGEMPCIHKVVSARSIFVPSHLLENLVKDFGEVISARVLITGNSDMNFDLYPELPKSTRLWLGQNLAVGAHETIKVRTIPIGLENLALGRAGLPKFIRSKKHLVEDRVLVPPMAPSNPIRQTFVLDIQKDAGVFDLFVDYLDEQTYFNLVSRYRFVLCLEGNGFENHRIWETLYRDSFPVMLKSPWSLGLKSLNLPILYIEKPSDCTPERLQEFLRDNSDFRAKNSEMLWMEYWKALVRKSEGA
jgi:hypothetical protein